MPITNTTKCWLCGAEGPYREMAVLGSPALGSQVDFALSVSWFCPEPCFEKARHSERIRSRVYAEHDVQERENQANLRAALQADPATLLDLDTLPEGLRVTERDLARLAAVDGDLSAGNLQDPETVRACFRLLRNHARLPFFHPTDGELWDYDETRSRFEQLEERR